MILRPVEPPDVDVFYQHQLEPEAARRANNKPRALKPFMAHWRDRVLGDETVHVRTVEVDGQAAGYVVAWWQEGRRTVGYWFGSSFWGRGIGTKALTEFLTLETTRPLYADTDLGNFASRRLLQRCGFRVIETTDYVLFQLD
jgi:RimJ/RimL family protein N-acetyltransferase